MRKLTALIVVFAFAVMISSCGRKTPVKLTDDTNKTIKKENKEN